MAKTNLVPIRVKIKYGLHPKTGKLQHIYPDFNALPPSVRENMDWSEFFDARGIGWHYDHFSGIGEVDVENPDPDVWYGCTCVPKPFADAAVAMFSGDVEVRTKTQFETFYNDRAHKHEPEVFDDDKALTSLRARVELGDLRKTDSDYLDAVNPDSPTLGRRRNKKKTWASFKTLTGAEFDPSVQD